MVWRADRSPVVLLPVVVGLAGLFVSFASHVDLSEGDLLGVVYEPVHDQVGRDFAG